LSFSPSSRNGVAVVVALAALTSLRCGTSTADDGGSAPPVIPSDPEGGSDAAGDGEDVPPTPSCRSDAIVKAIGDCIDGGGAPRACLAKSRVAGAEACDADLDGLDDALEDAMLRSYAPVFAFNEGDGGHTGGDSEPIFPTNLKHYVAHSTLYWRVDGDDGTKKVVEAKPTLDTLRNARWTVGGVDRRADATNLGQGPSFWLCLNQDNGKYPPEALVSSLEASRQLADGIDVLGVAHPTGKDPGGRYVVLEYMLFYAYNEFTLDRHEGDFEGGAVFVDTESGKVVAAFTDRHPTADTVTLIPLEGPGALTAKDPAGEAPHYNVCEDTSTSEIGGVRFWDHGARSHHPVIYTAAGGHASYGYPGATKLKGLGCTEATMIRDVHNGLGPKLVLHESAYAASWDPTAPKNVVYKGVHFVNLGERPKLRAAWSAFAGQWGCTLDSIPKSYPGPWDNERLCRHWLTNDWGAAPPFARSTATTCAP
jgi:hypothetical protein